MEEAYQDIIENYNNWIQLLATNFSLEELVEKSSQEAIDKATEMLKEKIITSTT